MKFSSTRPHSATARIEYGKSWDNYQFNLSLNGRALSKVETNKYVGNNPDKVELKADPTAVWKGLTKVKNMSWRAVL